MSLWMMVSFRAWGNTGVFDTLKVGIRSLHLIKNLEWEGNNSDVFMVLLDLFQFAIVWAHLLGHAGNTVCTPYY